jgi:hypothetical protein
MIVSVRNWTVLSLPRRALRAVRGTSEKAHRQSSRVGFFESWQNTLEQQANLVVESMTKM